MTITFHHSRGPVVSTDQRRVAPRTSQSRALHEMDERLAYENPLADDRYRHGAKSLLRAPSAPDLGGE